VTSAKQAIKQPTTIWRLEWQLGPTVIHRCEAYMFVW